MTGNTADWGRGLFFQSCAGSITNSIVRGNSAPTDPQIGHIVSHFPDAVRGLRGRSAHRRRIGGYGGGRVSPPPLLRRRHCSGGAMTIKVIGEPGTSPVKLALGSGVEDPPVPVSFGLLHLLLPLVFQIDLGTIPADGILSVPVTMPSNWQVGEIYPFQALAGPFAPGSNSVRAPILPGRARKEACRRKRQKGRRRGGWPPSPRRSPRSCPCARPWSP